MKPKLLLHLVWAATFVAAAAPLQCEIGPITKVFGSVPWLLYSCDDGRSLVVVSAPGSPAAPFYFMFSLEGGNYRLRGEGSGSKVLTDAALEELRVLREKDIGGLVAQTIIERKRRPHP